MCADCQRRAVTNPLRVFDCKVPEDQPIIDTLPRISQFLDEDSRKHFEAVQEILTTVGVPFHTERPPGARARLLHADGIRVHARCARARRMPFSAAAGIGPSMARWLNRDVRIQSKIGQPGVWSAFLLGFAFAFGWTPCIGPILATVLALAAASDTIARGVLLLAVYSAGLAVPFLADRAGHRAISAVLSKFSKVSACRGSFQRRAVAVCRRTGVRQQTDMALG